MVALPVVPVDSITEAVVFSFQVEAVQVGVVAGRVPPGAGKPDCAVVAPGIVVAVDCAKLGAPGRETLSEV